MEVNIDPDTICLPGCQLKCVGRFDQSGDLPALQAGASVIQEHSLRRDWNINWALLLVHSSSHVPPPPPTNRHQSFHRRQLAKSKIQKRKNRMDIDRSTSEGPTGAFVKSDWGGEVYLWLCSLLLKKGVCGQLQHVFMEQTPSPCNTACLGSPITSVSLGLCHTPWMIILVLSLSQGLEDQARLIT